MKNDIVTIPLSTQIIDRMAKKLSLIEVHRIGRDKFYTSPLFWDCECEEHYIHPVNEDQCLLCDTRREDQPDARVDEVLNHTRGLPSDLLQVIEERQIRFAPISRQSPSRLFGLEK